MRYFILFGFGLSVLLLGCKPINKNVDPTIYYVTYNGNGYDGGSIPVSQTFNEGGGLTTAGAGDFYKNGYAFYSWNSEPNGSGDTYSGNKSYQNMPEGNLNLYAQWVSLNDVEKREMNSIPGGQFYHRAQVTPCYDIEEVSNFKIGRYEVTRELFMVVGTWAMQNGYHIDVYYTAYTIGSKNIVYGLHYGYTSISNQADSHGYLSSDFTVPVVYIDWREAIIWCNAYSEMSGLDPVYYSDANFENVLRDTGDVLPGSELYTNPYADWTANGYRLPTIAEWMYVASYLEEDSQSPMYSVSGSTVSYSSSEDIDPVNGIADGIDSISNYAVYYKEDAEETIELKPVGSKLPNQLGVFDMSGNASEWVWDFWDYNILGPNIWGFTETDLTVTTDCRGEDSGYSKNLMGGDYSPYVWGVSYLNIYMHHGYTPSGSNHVLSGFRVVQQN